MGFSVSGSAAIVFVGAFIALGILQPAVSNGMERVNDAQSADADQLLEERNTDLDLTSATHYDSNDTIVVQAVNTGTTALSLNDTDFLRNNTYESPVETEVDGDANTTVWLPGEELTATLDVSGDGAGVGDRVTVVVEHGVRDAEEAS